MSKSEVIVLLVFFVTMLAALGAALGEQEEGED